MIAGAAPQPTLRITTTRESDEVVTLKLSGEADIATAPNLRQALGEAIEGSTRSLELDLRECRFIDSTGLHAIIEAGRSLAEKGRSLTLRSPQEHVRRLFLTAGIDRIEGVRLSSDGSERTPDSTQ
jgi:anti-sigma B factor antagonist